MQNTLRLALRSVLPSRALPALALAMQLSGCAKEPDVVIYCALDQVFSEPLLERFEAETGLVVRAEFDIEQHKTVGLVRRLREEQNRPRCDVFWNNEIANTVALARDGLLASYDSPSAADIPERFRDPEHRWTGFAARARILIVNTERVPESETPTGMQDLLDPRWRTQVGMAKPLTGTTLTHFTALYSVLGDEAADAYIDSLLASEVNLTRSNGQLMKLVSTGQLALGWTDTDDFNVARLDGYPVVAVYPDQQAVDGKPALGTMLIPNTVAILANAPHEQNAKRLVDWILSREIERELAFSRSAQIPVRSAVERPEHVRSASDFVVMEVDYATVGAQIDERLKSFTERFID